MSFFTEVSMWGSYDPDLPGHRCNLIVTKEIVTVQIRPHMSSRLE